MCPPMVHTKRKDLATGPYNIYTMEFYFTVRNDEIFFSISWMELEEIVLSEVSQKKMNTVMFSLTGGT